MEKIRIVVPEDLHPEFPKIGSNPGVYKKIITKKNNIITKKEIEFIQKCPDEVIGTIAYYGKTFAKFEKRKDYDQVFVDISKHNLYLKKIQQAIKGKILIILESPHKDEFGIESLTDSFSENSVNTRPANGPTGENIERYLVANLNKNIAEIQKIMGEKIDSSGVYSVSVMNAIPYQCSLGENTIFYRDECFLKMWSIEEVRNDFLKRLQTFDPDLIINACTLGKGYNQATSKPKDLTKKTVKSFLSEDLIAKKPKGFKLKNLIQDEIIQKYQDRIIQISHPSSRHFKT